MLDQDLAAAVLVKIEHSYAAAPAVSLVQFSMPVTWGTELKGQSQSVQTKCAL